MPPKKTKKVVKKVTKSKASSKTKTDLGEDERNEVEIDVSGEKLEGESDFEMDVEAEPSPQNIDPFAEKVENEQYLEKSESLYNEIDVDNLNVDLEMEENSMEIIQIQPPSEPYIEGLDGHLSGDELLRMLGEMVDLLMKLSKELEDQEEEEEEGAIKEDEVPFERFPDENEPTSVLVLLNFPPEMDSKKVIDAFSSFPELVINVSVVNKTKFKVFFTTQSVAMEAKSKLDNLKLYNRRIQALYNVDFSSSTTPTSAAISNNFQPTFFQNNFNLQKFPNFPGNQVPPPPTSSYTGPAQDRYKITFGKYKLLNTTLHQLLLQVYKDRNFDSGSRDLFWEENRSFYENLVEFENFHHRLGLSTRYVLVGNIVDVDLDDSNSVNSFMAKYTSVTFNYNVLNLPSNYPPNDSNNSEPDSQEEKKWLYVVFEKNRDASNFFNKLRANPVLVKEPEGNEGKTEGRELMVRYACPLCALESLWIGNVCEFCGYFSSEDELYSFFDSLGVVRNFKLVYESNCIFVTYQNKQTATRVYNFLNTLSPKKAIKSLNLNNGYNNIQGHDTNTPRVSMEELRCDSMDFSKEMERDYDLLNVDFNSGRNDSSFMLGQKLLNAIKKRADSQELIDRLLNYSELPPLQHETQYQPLNKRFRTFRRDFDIRRRERPRYERRYHREPYRETYRETYRESYRERDSYRDREQSRYRQRHTLNKESKVDRFGRTIRPHERMKREEPWKHSNKYQPKDSDMVDVVKEFDTPIEKDSGFGMDVVSPPIQEIPVSYSNELSGVKELHYCKLLKRGKYICKVSCVFIRGDDSHKLPELLDVNQRANPERLKNYLTKTSELSLWQLGADSKEDSNKYDSLCDYLISKNRVALVQQGPYEIYIVPPQQQYIQMLNAPDSQFMYAYILSKS